MQFAYPTSKRIMEIERDKLPTLKGDDPIYKYFPEMSIDEWTILWEQWDNISGLAQWRGLNNAPPPVKPLGIRRMALEPGVYGEHYLIDERMLSTRRSVGTFGTSVDVSDLVLEGSDQLATRDYSRCRYMMWSLVQTGSYAVTDKYNVVGHQLTYTPQTYTASVAWSTPATSTPLQDFRNVANLGGLGTSAVFDGTADAWLNMTTFNRMLANTNSADLFGRRTMGLGTINNPGDLSKLFVGDNLPSINILQDGYFDDTQATLPFAKYIADGKVVIFGRRPSGSLGNFVLCRNVNNPNMAAGRYMRVKDKDIDANGPRSIEIHRGFNGTPLVKYPRAIYVMNV